MIVGSLYHNDVMADLVVGQMLWLFLGSTRESLFEPKKFLRWIFEINIANPQIFLLEIFGDEA